MRSLLENIILMVLTALLLVGCTAKKPEITSLGKLDAITFDHPTVALSSWTIGSADGTCPSQINRMQVSFDGSTWWELSSFDPTSTLTCGSNGRFHFQVDFNAVALAAYKTLLLSGQSISFRARGFSPNGMTEDGVVQVSYTVTSSSGGELYVGPGKLTSGAYTLAGRISFPHSISGSQTLASGSYTLKGMIRSQ